MHGRRRRLENLDATPRSRLLSVPDEAHTPAVGRDPKTEIEGKMKQATGAAQDLYGQAKDAAGNAYGQAKEVAGDAARSVQQHAAPMEEFLRNAIESRPYSSVVAALCVGWFIGWMGRHSDY
jgi:ElaB/YqjD/DUF883 family membrane-anchored ribosome-binding protein